MLALTSTGTVDALHLLLGVFCVSMLLLLARL
jgi:hypothetical protein